MGANAGYVRIDGQRANLFLSISLGIIMYRWRKRLTVLLALSTFMITAGVALSGHYQVAVEDSNSHLSATESDVVVQQACGVCAHVHTVDQACTGNVRSKAPQPKKASRPDITHLFSPIISMMRSVWNPRFLSTQHAESSSDSEIAESMDATIAYSQL